MKLKQVPYLCVLLLSVGCGIYSFTGGDTGNAKTLQIDFFPNNAPLIEPGLSQSFTQSTSRFVCQTNKPQPCQNQRRLIFRREKSPITPSLQ